MLTLIVITLISLFFFKLNLVLDKHKFVNHNTFMNNCTVTLSTIQIVTICDNSSLKDVAYRFDNLVKKSVNHVFYCNSANLRMF